MEMLQKINFSEEVTHFFRRLPVDKDIESYKSGLIDYQELKKILVMCNQFFYITDVNEFSNVYVCQTLSQVLGYLPEEFLDIAFVYKTIHPDDMEFVYEFSKKAIKWSYLMVDILKKDPFAGLLSIDFRMRHKNGNYIRVNRQTSCFRTDNFGNTVYSISVYTDINHIKRSNLITYAWKTTTDIELDMDNLIERFQLKILTPREMEIIQMLSQGYSATQIAGRLFISEYTVIAHRRNILHKTGVKNTAELIKYGVEAGLI
jgi:DNA-binding CsgD family transcriptional regulator